MMTAGICRVQQANDIFILRMVLHCTCNTDASYLPAATFLSASLSTALPQSLVSLVPHALCAIESQHHTAKDLTFNVNVAKATWLGVSCLLNFPLLLH